MRPPVLPGLFTVPVDQIAGPDFDGATYQAERDQERLTSQLQRVARVMRDGRWWTLQEIATIAGDPLQSISARLRDLRKKKFMGWEIEHRVRAGYSGLWEYRRRV